MENKMRDLQMEWSNERGELTSTIDERNSTIEALKKEI